MNKMIIVFSLVVLVLILAAAAVFVSNKNFNPNLKNSTVAIAGKTFQVEIADTMVSRSQGLSGRESLSEDRGMIFLFSKPGMYGFWMKDMKFPIDIIWIMGDKIVSFSENLQPEPKKSVFSLPTFYPPAPVDKVLEINAGLVKKYNFQENDAITISP